MTFGLDQGALAPVPSALAQAVARLHLRVRSIADGLGVGLRRSVRTGQAVEFADYKPYGPGDSLKDLDWRVLGRRDRLVVRRYRAETELGVLVVFDASADLGSTKEKWETGISLVATIAYLASLENEPVGLVVAGGETSLARVLPMRRGKGHLARILATLVSVQPAGRAELASAFAAVAMRTRARSLVAMVGDFMEPPSEWTRSLDALLHRKADVRALQVYDRREFELDFARPIKLRFSESGREEPIDPAAMRDAVRAEGARFIDEVRQAFRSRRATHAVAEARAELAPILASFLRGTP